MLLILAEQAPRDAITLRGERLALCTPSEVFNRSGTREVSRHG